MQVNLQLFCKKIKVFLEENFWLFSQPQHTGRWDLYFQWWSKDNQTEINILRTSVWVYPAPIDSYPKIHKSLLYITTYIFIYFQ